uniref:Uncharacterized protein n=2 Tax=Babesia bovis TaxID=5865 RepID=A7ANI0_BABBO|eukprot:XP_001611682.1 hypothetical protein [Babesia bovis T2Bo]
MPTGNFASAILRKKGRLQTDAETQKFFETIGVTKDASLPHIINSYHNAIQTMSTERQKQLQETFEEFLRKDFVEAFEHMESYMQHGPAAWEEYWNPYKDEFGNPIEHSEERAMLKEHLIDEFTPPGINISEFREYWKANNTRFSAMMRNVDISARLRLTSNFFGRLPRACIFMLPVMGLGLFPQYSSLSLGIQGLLASGFIFKGDRESILAKEKTTETFLPLAEPVAKSKSSRTLVTSAVLTVHSLLGIGISKLLNAYTTLSEYLPYELLRVACINIQFFIAALLWDTSDMTRTAFVEREKKRMSKLSKYLTKLEPDEDE